MHKRPGLSSLRSGVAVRGREGCQEGHHLLLHRGARGAQGGREEEGHARAGHLARRGLVGHAQAREAPRHPLQQAVRARIAPHHLLRECRSSARVHRLRTEIVVVHHERHGARSLRAHLERGPARGEQSHGGLDQGGARLSERAQIVLVVGHGAQQLDRPRLYARRPVLAQELGQALEHGELGHGVQRGGRGELGVEGCPVREGAQALLLRGRVLVAHAAHFL
mmetsp:Transcript_18602/g.58882  ORF Transcript_18602/g.58882 Transcript_18602/m.58882 type:complete len:223 (-) Transcript_18602:761-1429(-)